MDLFDQVGMHTNVGNMVSMLFHPCRTIGDHYAEAYGLRMMGEGITYQERLRQQVRDPKCNVDLLVGSLVTHW